MTEWEKKEEQHCQALEEAEELFREILLPLKDLYLPSISDEFEVIGVRHKIERWLKKWCKEE